MASVQFEDTQLRVGFVPLVNSGTSGGGGVGKTTKKKLVVIHSEDTADSNTNSGQSNIPNDINEHLGCPDPLPLASSSSISKLEEKAPWQTRIRMMMATNGRWRLREHEESSVVFAHSGGIVASLTSRTDNDEHLRSEEQNVVLTHSEGIAASPTSRTTTMSTFEAETHSHWCRRRPHPELEGNVGRAPS